ncbi:MAG: succinate dehydrogenase [Candidatus Bathyarchaeia archaeon]|jgi:succinate dehydrogenase hydrophobic anchor subunit
MKESTKMLIHYATGLGILVAGGLHLFTVFLTGPYLQNLAFSGGPYSVIEVYRNVMLAATLELLLIFVDYHALNGIRVILIEFHQGQKWERGVSWILTVAGILLLVYGTRTILIANALA